jgi:hypothetical protein
LLLFVVSGVVYSGGGFGVGVDVDVIVVVSL